MKKLLILLLITFGSYAQNIVKDTSNVKKPSEGKLYYQKKDKALYLYRDAFVAISKPVTSPPVTNPPNNQLQEIPLGYWFSSDKILIAKLINGKYHLMQTNAEEGYYVSRGKNLLNDPRTKINSDIFTGDIVPDIVSTDSDLGGLYPANNFPEAEFLKLGYIKNTHGEYIKSTNTPVTNNKIKIPVGAIMWDSWYRDYWNDANPKYNPLINVVSKQRFIATEYMDKFNTVPFYGQYHSPEKIKIFYNIRYSPEQGKNIYDEVEKHVQVKFDKYQADTDREIKYYADAGFDFLCFNYYNSDSPLSEARQQFVNSVNKRGLKMTFILAPERSDKEIEYIADLMTKDYWFRIDNKPVLYFDKKDISDLAKYRSEYTKKGGGDIYLVYYNGLGYPDDLPVFQQNGAKAASSYTLFLGQSTADEHIKNEVIARETWMRQFKETGLSLIPVLSTGFENLYNRSSLDIEPVKHIEKASSAQIGQKLELMKTFINQNPTKVPAILWYAANEILESGNPIVPTKRKDGSIDTSMLDTIAKHLE